MSYEESLVQRRTVLPHIYNAPPPPIIQSNVSPLFAMIGAIYPSLAIQEVINFDTPYPQTFYVNTNFRQIHLINGSGNEEFSRDGFVTVNRISHGDGWNGRHLTSDKRVSEKLG